MQRNKQIESVKTPVAQSQWVSLNSHFQEDNKDIRFLKENEMIDPVVSVQTPVFSARELPFNTYDIPTKETLLLNKDLNDEETLYSKYLDIICPKSKNLNKLSSSVNDMTMEDSDSDDDDEEADDTNFMLYKINTLDDPNQIIR